MNQDNDKLLEVFLATSGYTIRALEEATDDMKESVSVSNNAGLRSIYLDRIEELESQLNTITKLGQE